MNHSTTAISGHWVRIMTTVGGVRDGVEHRSDPRYLSQTPRSGRRKRVTMAAGMARGHWMTAGRLPDDQGDRKK